MTVIIPAGLADLEVLSQVIADAYFDLPPSRWLIADPDARRQAFPAYFRILLDRASTSGMIYTTPDLDGVAVWIPVENRPSSPPPDYPARLRAATSPWTGRFKALDAALARRHPAGSPHDHLALLAVRPGRQGRGTGTALLHARHQHLDNAGVPAYLEASAQHSRNLCLCHGYRDLAPPIRLPGGPTLYPLWREPLLRTSPPHNSPAPGYPPPAPASYASVQREQFNHIVLTDLFRKKQRCLSDIHAADELGSIARDKFVKARFEDRIGLLMTESVKHLSREGA